MVIRTITSVAAVFLLTLLTPSLAQACFGPKLFVGAGQGERNDVLYALVTLYIQEKTGVESTRVEIDAGRNPLELISADKADLVFVSSGQAIENTVFSLGDLPVMVTGKRPLEELQFTTVLPAIRKLNRLLKHEDVTTLVRLAESGASAMAVVRKFFMEHRWI